MKLYTLKLTMPDDWVSGDCSSCPLLNEFNYLYYQCKLEYTHETCPLQEAQPIEEEYTD